MKKPFFLSALLLMVTGLEVSPPDLTVRAENPTPIVTENLGLAIQTQLELIDRGSFPRQKLLFAPSTVNQKEILTATMDMDMVMTIEGELIQSMDMPTIEMTMETDSWR